MISVPGGRTAIILQARFASTRLPGKVMKTLAGETVLSHVLRRCIAVAGVDVVCCAVSDDVESDPIAAEAERCGAEVFRGSEDDVRDRYLGAAKALGAEVILRVTSDCPLIDPEVCAQVLRLRAERDADYACNNLPPTWPHGLDCEAFTTRALMRAAAESTEPEDREHVTPWLRRHPDVRRATLAGPGGEFAAMRWTLDYPEDLMFFTALFDHLPRPPAIAGFNAVTEILRVHAEIAALNDGRRDAARAVDVGASRVAV